MLGPMRQGQSRRMELLGEQEMACRRLPIDQCPRSTQRDLAFQYKQICEQMVRRKAATIFDAESPECAGTVARGRPVNVRFMTGCRQG